MSDADEIAKLAELRDKGVISGGEFRRKKYAILHPPKRRGFFSSLFGFCIRLIWFCIVLAVLAVIVGILSGAFVAGNLKTASLPACDLAAAKAAVGDVYRDNPASKIISTKLLALDDVREIRAVSGEDPERICSGHAYFNSGDEWITFKLFHLDRNTGQYLIETNPAK